MQNLQRTRARGINDYRLARKLYGAHIIYISYTRLPYRTAGYLRQNCMFAFAYTAAFIAGSRRGANYSRKIIDRKKSGASAKHKDITLPRATVTPAAAGERIRVCDTRDDPGAHDQTKRLTLPLGILFCATYAGRREINQPRVCLMFRLYRSNIRLDTACIEIRRIESAVASADPSDARARRERAERRCPLLARAIFAARTARAARHDRQ